MGVWFVEIDYGTEAFGPFANQEAAEEKARELVATSNHIELLFIAATRSVTFKH